MPTSCEDVIGQNSSTSAAQCPNRRSRSRALSVECAMVFGRVAHQGWLHKRGEHIRTWRARYFLLYECGELVGYRTWPADVAGESEPRAPDNRYSVRGCRLRTSDRPRPHAFVLCLRAYEPVERHFSLDSDDQRSHWMTAISEVAERLLGSPARESYLMSLDNYEFVRMLGRGAFGKVMLSRERSSGKLYVIQVVKRRASWGGGSGCGSGGGSGVGCGGGHHVLEMSSHPFLTALRHSFQTARHVCYLMEFANGGDLQLHLAEAGSFPEPRARFYAAEMTAALGHLHDEGIVHRDLRLENVLLDRHGHIKITNFGFSKADMRYGDTTGTHYGALEYLAPEQHAGLPYGPAVDWWALGVALYHMVCGRLPFAAVDTVPRRLLYDQVRFPSTVSVECRALVAGLLALRPAERLGASPDDALDVMHHAFFASIEWNDLLAKKVPPPFRPPVDADTDARLFQLSRLSRSLQPPPDALCSQTGREVRCDYATPRAVQRSHSRRRRRRTTHDCLTSIINTTQWPDT
ncbi:PREDICTED: RAC-alpha serine/threonine-protein kinase-like isoform X2 [Papilio xuthus]|uniref:RAC-alpha serine/threonine-protein kinase-like isoform X2 n=1 Tax=Papilio xuthus TaxID=66420 RepID=A0AAJ6ZHP6_PAPXU|nr:PREDICTED: RAC-alpha serine/threonine-protein kinase-like isoform X2 [Papilio xuthus]